MDNSTREFDFFFLPSEISALADIIVPKSMIVVCNELADDGFLTLFNLSQALQYGSYASMYFRTELPEIPTKRLRRSDGSEFLLIDDLSVPEHLGIFAHRSIPPSLPRVSISLTSSFHQNDGTSPASDRIVQVFESIRAELKRRAIAVRARGTPVLVSVGAHSGIVAGEFETGDAAVDQLVRGTNPG